MTFAAFPYAQPVHGLAGGVLIGLAAAMMLLGAGRIAGVSGIIARATAAQRRRHVEDQRLGLRRRAAAWARWPSPSPTGLEGRLEFAPWPVLVVAGLLVGFGTRMGSGCTSGHGVCGVSRLSQRSMLATATFMAAGIATVAVTGALS